MLFCDKTSVKQVRRSVAVLVRHHFAKLLFRQIPFVP